MEKLNNGRPSGKLSLGGILLRAALLLLCLVLLTVHLMGSLFAKYSTTASGSDSARVARFDVQANCFYDNENDKYTLTITNDSEVTVAYAVSYSCNGEDLPVGVTITFGDNNSGTLAPGGEIEGDLTVSDESTAAHGELQITVSVTATQVD